MGQSLGWETAQTWPRLWPLTSITSRTAVYVPHLDFNFALHLTLFYSVYLWSINVPWTTHYLHHNYNLMTICVLFMQLKLTSLDKILADLIFRPTACSFRWDLLKSINSVFFLIPQTCFCSSHSAPYLDENICGKDQTSRRNRTPLPVAEVSSGSKDLWKSWPSLLVMV